TTRSIEALKPNSEKRVEVQDDDVRGLYVRVSPKGVKSWMLRATTKDGRRIKIGLDDFPAVGLSEARDRARREIVAIRDGHDPAAERRKAKRTARHERITKPQTVSQLWRHYEARPKKRRKSTQTYQAWLWKKHIEPHIGSAPLKELDRATIK